MSDDLIKRSDAIKALRKLGHEVVVIDKVCSLGVAAEFIDAIRDIPSADLNAEFAEWAKLWFKKELEADRPQGEWIEHHKPFTWMGFTYWTCSECGYGENNQNWIQSNFCPNCGADMRKGADDGQRTSGKRKGASDDTRRSQKRAYGNLQQVQGAQGCCENG